jgi:glycosyltransferase involved in cell wall biosynthesis
LSMNILYLAPYFSLRLGGVSEVVSQAAKHLVQRGHQVTVLAGNYAREPQNQEAFPFQLVYLASFSRWGFYVTPGLIPWLRDHLDRYDLVHLHEFRTFQNIIASSFAAHSQKPFFLTGHGTVPNIIERQGAKQLFDRLFQKKILGSIDTFIAVSPQEVEDYHRLGIQSAKIRLVYNGVVIPEDGKWRDEVPLAGIGDGGRIILFLGRLHKLKKIDVLVKAFALLSKQLPDACLVIAGPDGGAQPQLESLAARLGIQDKVRFTGPVFGEDKAAWYRAASVLAYPSAYEIFGLVPLEALLCGTPVVVTQGPGMGRIIEEAQAGKTVPTDDPAALAEGIAWVLDHPQAARQQVLAGQAFIHDHLTWENIAAQLEAVYLERTLQSNG